MSRFPDHPVDHATAQRLARLSSPGSAASPLAGIAHQLITAYHFQVSSFFHPPRSVAAIVLALSSAGAAPAAPLPAVRPLTLTATVAPLGQVARLLAGPDAEISVLIPPGADDETYEPTQRQVETLERATLVLRVGHPAIGLEARVLAPFCERHPQVATLALLDDAAPGPGLSAAMAGDPHLWMSPATMRRFAARVAVELDRQDPAGSTARAARLGALDERLAGLEAALRAVAASGASFIVVHPAFGALERDFGLHSLAIERDGKEPGMASLVGLVREARASGVHWVVTQPGFATRLARTVAAELGASEIEIDPLAADWVGNLERLAGALAQPAARP